MTRNTATHYNTHTFIRNFNIHFLLPIMPVKKDVPSCERVINKALVNLQIPLV